MKGMVAMEVAILRMLAEEARRAGRDPATDPIPGLTRDVLFASTADEEAGGVQGAGWVAEHRPDWIRAAGAVNEAGGVSIDLAGRRFYPIQVAEKGFIRYRIHVHGTWGHGSMPREDNAAVRASEVMTRIAPFDEANLTPVMQRLFEIAAAELPEEAAKLARAVAGDDERRRQAALEKLCDVPLQRAVRALLRDTMSPNMIHSGIKFNVIPGAAEIEIDVRNLPGTPEPEMRERIRRRLGEELWANVELEPLHVGPPVEASVDTDLYRLLADTLKAHDPEGIPVPTMAPFATDAKHTMKVGTPTYGFSPLRLHPEDRFLELFHGVDERVSLEGLRFGVPVLYDVVRQFAGVRAR
jgi:acetylornithine deacetylase/succinyl-diaminopimelate desuccinylase-like protein